jgi:hypothetical protein
LARAQALIDGLQAKYPNGNLQFGGTSYPTATLVALFQSVIDAIKATNAVQASAKNTLAAQRSVEQKALPIMRDLKRYLQALLGNDVQALAVFGLEPRKVPAPKTVQQLATAQAKAEATRKARGTKSRKAKRSIKGNVTGVTVTPVTAQPEPTPAPQPAPSK